MKRRNAAEYLALLAACFLFSLAAGWTSLGQRFDNAVLDFLFRVSPPTASEATSAVLGIDEETFTQMGGVRGIRKILCSGLEQLSGAQPKAVAIDLILADEGDERDDACLERAFAATKNLILAADMPRGKWEEPIERFRKSAAAVGHVHAEPDVLDSVVRQIGLEKIAGHRRFWALALEAYRVSRGVEITEDPGGLDVGGLRIPGRRADARLLRVRYLQAPIPTLSFTDLRSDPATKGRLRGKTIFIGITADSGAQDRHYTPNSSGHMMPGVEINANAYETLAQGLLLGEANNLSIVLVCAAICLLAGLVFWRLAGWPAYILGAIILAAAALAPALALRLGEVFSAMPPFLCAALSLGTAATYQHFAVRRTLRYTEAEKQRYEKAIHWAAHEMRTPLMAIQGSSEIMGRYKLPDEKRSEIARMINSESKRLAKMIQTFLDVERLSAGQMELKQEPFGVAGVIDVCLDRVKSLAEGKKIRLLRGQLQEAVVTGDRELMEYAVYNLLTNAIKYSPAETTVTVGSGINSGRLRLSVQDQGMGIDEKDIENLGRKFYRTKKAEASGISGTGIGLSIVEQIVANHGGKLEVTSSPGAGSCFTIVVPAAVPPANLS